MKITAVEIIRNAREIVIREIPPSENAAKDPRWQLLYRAEDYLRRGEEMLKTDRKYGYLKGRVSFKLQFPNLKDSVKL